jgi:hypothetical protein
LRGRRFWITGAQDLKPSEGFLIEATLQQTTKAIRVAKKGVSIFLVSGSAFRRRAGRFGAVA